MSQRNVLRDIRIKPRVLALTILALVIVLGLQAWSTWIVEDRFALNYVIVIGLVIFAFALPILLDALQFRAGRRTMRDEIAHFNPEHDTHSETGPGESAHGRSPTPNQTIEVEATTQLGRAAQGDAAASLSIGLGVRIVALLAMIAKIVELRFTERLEPHRLVSNGNEILLESGLGSLPALYIAGILAGVVFLIEPWLRLRLMTYLGLSLEIQPHTYAFRYVLWWVFYWVVALILLTLLQIVMLDIARNFPFSTILEPWSFDASLLSFAALAYVIGMGIYYVLFGMSIKRNLRRDLNVPEALIARQKHLKRTGAALDRPKPRGPYDRLLTWIAPPAAIASQNPLFNMDVQKLKYGGDWTYLRRWTLRIARRVVLSILGLSALFALWRWESYQTFRSFGGFNPPPFIYQALSEIVVILGFISIVANVMLDFASVNASLHTINRDITTGRWDLIRLTVLPQRDILQAKYDLTQLQAWRMTILVLTLRMLTVLGFAFLALIPIFDGSNGLQDIVGALVFQPLSSTIGVIVGIVFLVIFLCEPVWRMRAFTARMLGVSVQRDTVNGLLYGLGWVVALWIAQVALLIGLGWFIGQVSFQFFRWMSPQLGGNAQGVFDVISIILLILTAIIFSTMIYVYYWLIRKSSLRIAARRAFREQQA